MLQFIHPVLGTLMLVGAVGFCFMFVIALIVDACWQKRQARLLREAFKGKVPQRKRPLTRWRAFLKQFGWKSAAFAIVIALLAVLVRARDNTSQTIQASSGQNGLSTYAANFQGDATYLVSATDTKHSGFAKAKLSSGNNTLPTGKTTLEHRPIDFSLLKKNLAKGAGSNAVVVAVRTVLIR